MHKHLNMRLIACPDNETQRPMGILRQGDTDSRLQRLRMCKHSSTLNDKMHKALKHRDKVHTEMRT